MLLWFNNLRIEDFMRLTVALVVTAILSWALLATS